MPVSNSKPTASSNKGNKPRTTNNSQSAGFTQPLTVEKVKRSATKPTDLQRKIKQVEQQLERAATSFMEPEPEKSNSQTTELLPLEMASNKKIVSPGSRDAPKFHSKRPEDLIRFIDLIEDLWKEAGITDDETKKSTIGRYADKDSEEEWAAFKTFRRGHSWEEFKQELIKNYPQAAAAERGTPARIRQLCAEQSKVRIGDMVALYTFARAFNKEAKKLQEPPVAMANRELVELFLGCLSESFVAAVLQALNLSKPNAKAREADGSVARRPEDKYDLDDVYRTAIEVSENSSVMFDLMKKEAKLHSEERGVLLFNQPISETNALNDRVQELEGIQALERDRLVSVTKTMESKMSGIEELMKSLLAQSQTGASQGACKGDCKGNNCKTHEPSSASGPTQRWGGRTMENEKCFWCGLLGHFQADCDDLKNQIRAGNVKVNQEGKLRLRDGSFIPNQPTGASLKEKVERHYSKKPSQFYYGEYEESDPTSPFVPKYAQYLGASEDAEKRVARLEAELELRKREDALEVRKKKLELEEKKLEQASGSAKATNVLDLLGQLTEEEVVAIKAARLGFP